MATHYDELPIFPLPRLVFMPGSLLPLHVFEPRYRALVEHCMSGDGRMGIATLRDNGESTPDGEPPIHPEIGVGKLVRVKPFPDGRSNIVLSYEQTAHLIEELPRAHPFRTVSATAEVTQMDGLAGPVSQLRALLLQLGVLSPATRDELESLSGLSDADLVDDLAVRLLHNPDERRHYTTIRRQAERAELLMGQLAMAVSSVSPLGEA